MTVPVGASTPGDRLWRAVPAVMCTVAIVAAASAVALSLEWLPAIPTGEAAQPRPGAMTAATWADVHLVTVVATIALALASFVTASRITYARRRRIGTRALFLAIVTCFGMIFVRPLVFWEEITLRQPTFDPNWQGMWPVAFSDQLLTVVVDLEEVEQGAYRLAMVTHTILLPAVLVLTASIAAWQLCRAGH